MYTLEDNGLFWEKFGLDWLGKADFWQSLFQEEYIP